MNNWRQSLHEFQSFYHVSLGRKASLLRRSLFVLWKGLSERKRERASIPSSPARFLFFFRFDYCYFYRNTQREPLRRREAAGSETGRRISFGSLQLEKTAEIQPTRAIAQALSEHVETFLSSTVEKCFALAENWMKY